jgi:hypothetical protein
VGLPPLIKSKLPPPVGPPTPPRLLTLPRGAGEVHVPATEGDGLIILLLVNPVELRLETEALLTPVPAPPLLSDSKASNEEEAEM